MFAANITSQALAQSAPPTVPALHRGLASYISFSALFVLLIFHLGRNYLLLRQIPGPVIAGLTDWWRLLVVRTLEAHDTYFKIHEQYGDLVRVGPKHISICRPDTIQEIYGISKNFVKSDFYTAFTQVVKGQRVSGLLAMQDEKQAAQFKRPIHTAYALSTLVEFEPLIDSTTAVFLSRLDDLFASTGKVCNLGEWLQWYAFDVIIELTLSKRLGFLDRGEDIDGMIAAVGNFGVRGAIIGQMPWLDSWTYKNPIYLKYFAKSISSPVAIFAQKMIQDRVNGTGKETNPAPLDIKDPVLAEKVLHGTIPSKPDFLSRILKLHQEQPEIVPKTSIMKYLFINITAGGETTATGLRSIFYYLLKHPETYNKLANEILDASRKGTCTFPCPTWTEVQALPYLNAVVKEALRLCPPTSLPLERVVPASGLQIDSTFIPPGTVVGINAWVLHRDSRIFGADATSWRPQRWIPECREDAEKIKYMDRNLFTFGAGKRSCIGRHVAMLELLKLVPAVVGRYDMWLEDPEREWKVLNRFVLKQEGLLVRMKRREG